MVMYSALIVPAIPFLSCVAVFAPTVKVPNKEPRLTELYLVPLNSLEGRFTIRDCPERVIEFPLAGAMFNPPAFTVRTPLDFTDTPPGDVPPTMKSKFGCLPVVTVVLSTVTA